MLYLVATPIGHLEDFSLRAQEALKKSDAILCEDTRRTSQLLNRYFIQKPLISYHKFKERSTLDSIIQQLKEGKILSLVSDAGTPCINDPGRLLVQTCREEKIEIQAIPGPCSVIQALILSGFETTPFQFIGFLPKDPKNTLQKIEGYQGTTVAFESPERLIKTLKIIDPQRKIAVLREMTKVFEECIIGTAKELLEYFGQKKVKGEIVLVIEKGEINQDLSIEKTVSMLQEFYGLSLKEAIKEGAKLKNVPKSEVYKKFHHL